MSIRIILSPAGEAHSVLLHIQGRELLIVAQGFLLFAGDTEEVSYLCIGFQLYRLACVQTYSTKKRQMCKKNK